MLRSRLTFRLSIGLSVAIGSLLISGCSSEEPILMPAPQITRYVLDISGSNDYMEQWARLKPKIYADLNSQLLGSPYDDKPAGPKALSITFILRSASQAPVFEITNSSFGYLLFEDLEKVYGRSVLQMKDDWALILAASRVALNNRFTNVSSCQDSIWEILDPQLGESNSKIVANRVCAFMNEAQNKIEKVIPASLGPGGGSDVFGSLREIESWAKKLKKSTPNAVINVVIASDMAHNTDGRRDLFGQNGLLTDRIAIEEICEIAKTQAALSALQMSDISLIVIGRGNATSVNADEAEALAIFWDCFGGASGFEINFVTDGNE